MPPTHIENTGDLLRRFTLLKEQILRQKACEAKPPNPLDEFISEQRNITKDEVSKVRQVANVIEAKMSRKERWDGWRWTPPVHKEFGIIGDEKGNFDDPAEDSDSDLDRT